MKPNSLKEGEPARLIPIVADTSRERRVAAVFLAMMTQIPLFSGRLLSSVSLRTGQRTRIEAYTEVILTNNDEERKNRPDGLLVVDTGQRSWQALVEAKIGNQDLATDQICRYLELAKANDIDAVITLSNELVARADHHPVHVPRTLTRKVGLFHWPWMWVKTQAELIQLETAVTDREQSFLLDEFVRFLSHPSTGIDGFNQMNKEWRDLTRAVTQNVALRKTGESVEKTIGAWHQEERDLCLLLTRELGRPVKLKLERRYEDDPASRVREDCARLANDKQMHCNLIVPDAVDAVQVVVDLMRRSVTCSVKLTAPKDKKSTKARVNWLVRQLAKSSACDVIVRAQWPSRTKETSKQLITLREDPGALQTENQTLVPHTFEIAQVTDLAGKFMGRKTFIEELEKLVPLFYADVVQYLRAWQPAPPKPVKRAQPESSEEEPVHTPGAGTPQSDTQQQRQEEALETIQEGKSESPDEQPSSGPPAGYWPWR